MSRLIFNPKVQTSGLGQSQLPEEMEQGQLGHAQSRCFYRIKHQLQHFLSCRNKNQFILPMPPCQSL